MKRANPVRGRSGASAAIGAQLAAIKARGCFRCNATRKICDVCGEAANACGCRVEEQRFLECPDCKPPDVNNEGLQ